MPWHSLTVSIDTYKGKGIEVAHVFLFGSINVEKSTNAPDSPDGSGTEAGLCGEVQRTAGYKYLVKIKC